MRNILYRFESFLKRRVTRATFLKFLITGMLYILSRNRLLKTVFASEEESTGRPRRSIKTKHDLVVAEGSDPYMNTVRAIEAIGGMKLFVKPKSTVVVKPNIAWDRTPEQAANTDPQVVAAIVELCYKAGAKRVNVFDVPCNEDKRCYESSGIQKAAASKGAHVFFADHWNVVKAKLPYASGMNGWPILRDAVICDTFINVPVLKDHGLTSLTMSMKNLMGVCTGRRGLIHVDIGNKLVDLNNFINPELTVIDATRVLIQHGPSGGNIEDVRVYNKVIVSTDATLADTYAATMVGRDPMSIPNIRAAVGRGIGSADIAKARIETITV